MNQKLTKISLVIGTFLLSAYPVFAQINVVPEEVPRVTIEGIITTAIRLLVIVAFIISFVVLLIGGIRWMTSGGDPKNVEGARNMVTAGLIGLVIVLSSFALIRLIEILFDRTIISGPITITPIPQE